MRLNINDITEIFTENIDQIQLFAHFLNIDVNTIIDCIQNKKSINSPLRHDSNPSVSFYIKNNKIKMRDFAGYFWGDIYDLVGILNNMEVSYKTLPLIKSIIKNTSVETIKYQLNEYKKIIHPIVFTCRKWEVKDQIYWSKAELPLHYMTQMDTFPVQNAFFNNKLIYTYTSNDPCYAYHLGYKNNLPIIELYFPLRKKDYKYPKFITNSSIMKGVNKLKICDTLIITKSNKDRIAMKWQLLKRNIENIEVIALASESIYLTKKQAHYFKSKYKNIITIFDNDLTGIRATRYHRDNFQFSYVLLTHFFLRVKVKDFTQLISTTNPKFYNKLIDKFLQNYV